MNPIDHESTSKDDEKITEPGELLDESWFFGNLLHRKTSSMSRCYSDPCPSSNYSEDMLLAGKSIEETFSSLQKLPANGAKPSPSASVLMRTPSLPEESSSSSSSRAKGSLQRGLHRGNNSTAVNNLSRAPSLPSSIGREEIQDEESDFSMSRLIRQASLKQSDTLPPRHLPKSIVQGSSSTPRHRLRRKPDLETISSESPDGMIRRQHSISRSKLTKSSSDLVFQDLQGMRDLNIKFDKNDLGTIKSNKIASMQARKQQTGSEEMMKKSSSGEPWQAQKQSMDNGNKSVEDMKAQIKFWARAVASNVRQEC